ncbi:MAG TPA: bifunctional DNA-formamidopyrimidine glycosylase/DNA-(apurinic or apyrimidinic site) lyase [Burkholderiales bacterium]|nr:bifunctional DNA-formamidopyrimidine glycosylase/DNA-(apurinic or apyrimidinic site) lyase [Burkholderiales bacterium]
MPELPEVETTRRGLHPALAGQRIMQAIVRNRDMRVPVPRSLERRIAGARISAVERRAKYLLIVCDRGTLIVHLGMSGRLWLVDRGTPPATHDHFDLVLESGATVRLRDPRRFGLVLWQEPGAGTHRLLANLGPEPFDPAFTGAYLHAQTRNRSAAIKQVIMDSHVVVGVGNIYASEALFRARINPRTAARRIGRDRYDTLVAHIRDTLEDAIRAGGSTLRDYVGSNGQAGYFQNEHLVYGRGGEPCRECGTKVRELRQGQRSTFYCPRCQK